MRKRMQGIVSIVVFVTALLGLQSTALSAELWSDVADTSWFNQQHAGTEADPYLIETAEHLAGLAKLVSDGNDFKDKYVLLTRDITMAGREWSPIGWMRAYGDLAGLAGTFDGGGHSITGITISTGKHLISHTAALFGYIDPAATVKNVVAMGSITNKKSNEIDSLLVRQLKGNIRRHESLAATRYEGVPDKHVHFLNLPFYETGGVKKNPIGEADIKIIMDLIEEVKPHQIYAAGDLADPHGTHKVCLDAIFAALKNLKHKDYMKDCWVWLYRGAWHEWDIHEIEMAVPMSPAQVLKKRQAIFFHQSQKDGAMFQGDDLREFWQRAEARNSETACRYRNLGFADYAAIEAFKRYFF